MAAKAYNRKTANFNLDTYQEALERVIQKMLGDPNAISYAMFMVEEKLTKGCMIYWEDKYPDEVGSMMDRLRDIRQARYEAALLEKFDGTNISSANISFYGRTIVGLMDTDKRIKLEMDKKKLELAEKVVDENEINTITIG